MFDDVDVHRKGSNKSTDVSNDTVANNGITGPHIGRTCQTYPMNDRTTRFGTFTCTHCTEHWIKAIATPGRVSLSARSWFILPKRVYQQEASQLRYT